MKSISEWLRMSKLTGFDVVVSPHMPEGKVAVVQGGKVAGVVTDSASAPLDEFKHWLDSQRDCTVAEVFHDIVHAASRLAYPHKCPSCGSSGFPVSVRGLAECTFCDGTEGGNPPGTDPEA